MIGPQVPATAPSQAWHCPVQALLQHTPSTQKLLVHWLAAEQVAAFERLGSQLPEALQKLPVAHCASVEQVEPQAVPLHR